MNDTLVSIVYQVRMNTPYINEIEKFLKYIRQNYPCKIAALDIGRKKTGFAICNTEVKVAVPRPTFINCSLKSISDQLKTENVKALIVGISLINNQIMQSKIYVKNCAEKIGTNLEIPVLLVDEVFTTSIANSMLKIEGVKTKDRYLKDDSMAALIMLDEFLEKL